MVLCNGLQVRPPGSPPRRYNPVTVTTFSIRRGLFVRHTKETTGAVPAFWWILPICSFHWPRSGENMTMDEGLRRSAASTVWNNQISTRPWRSSQSRSGATRSSISCRTTSGRTQLTFHRLCDSHISGGAESSPPRSDPDDRSTFSTVRAPGSGPDRGTTYRPHIHADACQKLRKTLMQVAFRC